MTTIVNLLNEVQTVNVLNAEGHPDSVNLQPRSRAELAPGFKLDPFHQARQQHGYDVYEGNQKVDKSRTAVRAVVEQAGEKSPKEVSTAQGSSLPPMSAPESASKPLTQDQENDAESAEAMAAKGDSASKGDPTPPNVTDKDNAAVKDKVPDSAVRDNPASKG